MVKTSEMVGRVAAAIIAAELQWNIDNEGHGGSVNADCPREVMARAAIEAMREPTQKMLKAACASMSPGKRPTPDRVNVKKKHRIRYGAMIEAALTQS